MAKNLYLSNTLADFAARGGTLADCQAFFAAREALRASQEAGFSRAQYARDAITKELPAILAALTGPTDTRAIAEALASVTGLAAHDFATRLQERAPEIPEARQDGEVFQRFGKTCRRWIWYPTAPTSQTCDDWDIPPDHA